MIKRKLFNLSNNLLNFIIPVKKIRNRFKCYVKNKLELRLLKKTYQYLSKYCKDITIDDCIDYQEVKINQLPIWQMWLQGENSAPPIVKKCLRSVKTHTTGREIIVLTNDNWHNYVELPDFIMNKFNQGIITYTHFSDILRICLLEKYGGTWIDATVLLTEKPPPEIANSSFFAFEVPEDSFYADFHLTSSWFIQAKPNHLIVQSLKCALFNYWKKENELIDYFLIHLLLKGLIDNNYRLYKLWEKAPHISNKEPHVLQLNLLANFNQQKFNEIIRNCTIHKLTYKINYVDEKNTFINKLLADERAE